mgnify:CR=1 FL=1|jgi:uncharacterized protein YecE (DUF72 family)
MWASRSSSGVVPVHIGLAGWSEAPSRHGKLLPAALEGATGLQRYAAAFDFVEINSSFYRQVRPATYEKWAGEVPEGFCFSVKMHRLITHYTRLKNTDLLGDFFGSVAGLGGKLAVVLVQLPPTLVFNAEGADRFWSALRKLYRGCVVCEPRHASWQEPAARKLLGEHGIGPVLTAIPAAKEDPLRGAKREFPLYVRLHGTPRKYHSSYRDQDLARLAEFLAHHVDRRRYVVFDNTAGPAGVCNALQLQKLVGQAKAV